MTHRARLIDGPFHGLHADLTSTPSRILIDGVSEYVILDDPDTADYLGGYYWTRNVSPTNDVNVSPSDDTLPCG